MYGRRDDDERVREMKLENYCMMVFLWAQIERLILFDGEQLILIIQINKRWGSKINKILMRENFPSLKWHFNLSLCCRNAFLAFSFSVCVVMSIMIG